MNRCVLSLSLLVLLFFLSCGKSANNNSTNALDLGSKEELELISLIKAEYDSSRKEMIPITNTAFIKYLVDNPHSLDYSFNKLQEETEISIETSEDGNFRVYSWDSYCGGSMPMYTNIFQYRSDGKVYINGLGLIDDIGINIPQYYQVYEDEDIVGSNVVGLITFNSSDSSVCYLLKTDDKIMHNCALLGLQAVKIQKGQIVSAPIFFTEEDGVSDKLSIEYSPIEWFYKNNNNENLNRNFEFEKPNQILYVPYSVEGNLVDRYKLFYFDGSVFRPKGFNGGYWLNKSLRDYKKLELLFNTKHYQVRIDQMSDGSLRFAVWNGFDMAKDPKYIIFNGKGNSQEGYVFVDNNAQLLFKISSQSANNYKLSVLKNGNEIIGESIDY